MILVKSRKNSNFDYYFDLFIYLFSVTLLLLDPLIVKTVMENMLTNLLIVLKSEYLKMEIINHKTYFQLSLGVMFLDIMISQMVENLLG